MTHKIFIDTNILVYAMDHHDPAKKEKNRSFLKSIGNENRGVISTQVIQEFYVTVTKKLGVDGLTTKNIIHSFFKFETIVICPELIDRAIDTQILNRLSFWDALIISAAESAHCQKVWTEALNHGQVIQGMTIENPFLFFKP